MTSASAPATPGFCFSAGAVLRRSLTVLGQKPLLFFGLAGVTVLPAHIMELLRLRIQYSWVVAQGVSTVLGWLVAGIIVCMVYKSLRGEAMSAREALSQSLTAFLPLLGSSILFCLGIGLGIVLLVVPGLILMCIWSVVLSACVIERLGAIESLRRSAHLTKGYRLPIFGILVLVLVLNLVLVGGALFALRLAGNAVSPVLGSVVTLCVQSLAIAPQYVMSGVLYHDLRAAREGHSLEGLANVFD